MCGIAGSLKHRPDHASDSDLHNCVRAIAHRGPDDEGYLFINRATGRWAQFAGSTSPVLVRQTLRSIEQAGAWVAANQPDVALGHCRFSIIDITPDGHQPFWDAEHRVCVICNGEIYNYIEVRAELEQMGHTFRTATDTEVLVESYRAWGDRCFEKLNGMWALALYDVNKRELILCRDRTGERPLYWVRNSNAIYFASEIRALLASEAIHPQRHAHDEAVFNFLYQAVSDLDKNTFFSGIESVPKATVVRIGMDGGVQMRRFWQLPETRPTEAAESQIPELCEELRGLLRDSVSLRLRADVPVNVALSGGMDSSSIVAMAAGLRGAGLDTYTVRFKEAEWNEWPFAKAVADKFCVRNMVIDPPSDWMWTHLASFVSAMEEPFHAPDLLPDHIIRRELAARGIKVNLSGIGGDEIFAGYDHYRRFRALDLKRSGNIGGAIKELVFASDTTPLTGALRLAQGKLHAMRLRGSNNRQDNILSEAVTMTSPLKLRELPQSCEARLQADVEWSLLPYWLRAGDKSSMAIPIEVRYPFLDHRLIEFAARLPVSLLIRDGWMKWFLRKAMEDLLPRGIAWRRKKMGFPFPIQDWMESSVAELTLVFSQMDNPYLSREFWTKRLAEAIQYDPWFVWRSLSFELWHRHFIRNQSVLPEQLVPTRMATPVDLAVSTA